MRRHGNKLKRASQAARAIPETAGKRTHNRGAWMVALACGSVASLYAILLPCPVAPVPPSNAEINKGATTNAPAPKSPRSLQELLALAPKELDGMDIGLMNLLCAGGLNGSEELDVRACVKELDAIASGVEFETSRHWHRFREHPAEFRNSEGYFRMLYLLTVIQQDGGIVYNPDRITPVGVYEPNSTFFADSRDVFIHGMLDLRKRAGTCASMPVLYAAVGRRLGYPLFLVPTKNHLFIRWEDRRERFNIDGTATGLNVYDDNKYRHWPLPVLAEEEREFGYLRPMTSAEELRAFLSLRGHCLLAMGRLDEGLAAHEAALRVAPTNREEQLIIADVREEVALRRARPEFLPPEQRWRAEFPRAVPLPAGVGRPVPSAFPDPNPLKGMVKMQYQLNNP